MEGCVRFVLPILAILSPLLCSGEQAVPLIAWSNTRSLANSPRISAGKVITREALGTTYMDSILQTQPQTIFLFVFDELSIEDITKYSDAYNANGQGGALSHLKQAMEESLSHLVLPAVEPGDLEADLGAKVNGAVIDLKEPTLEGVTLDPTKTNLIIMQLSVASSDSKREAFARADEIIGAMVQQRNMHYTAILTAMHKSQLKPRPQEGDKVTIGRRLLQDDKPTFIAHYKQDKPACNVYMTATAISLVTDLTKQPAPAIALPVKFEDWSTKGSTCTEKESEVAVTLVISLTGEIPKELDNFNMSLTFSKTRFNFWSVANTSFVEITEKGASSPVKYNIATGMTGTPTTFSYHCSDGVFRLTPRGTKAASSGATAQVTFTELQIQPFGITQKNKVDQFGPADDCVGFFTEGIWMGLFMGLIVILILSFGMSMLINLRVMDKFDDPKGKTITVNTGAE